MSTRAHLLILAFLWLPLPAAAEDMPDLPADSRIRILTYDETDVYTIVTKYGYQTNVVFGPSEEIQTISVGDRSLWQIIPSGNRLFIRPMEDNVITNMTVLTNRRSYNFDLKSVGPDKDNNIYVAKFIYPDQKRRLSGIDDPMTEIMAAPAPMPAAAPAPAAEPVKLTPAEPTAYSPPPAKVVAGSGVAEPANPNYNYTFSGPDELAPVQVYDDGKSTYIKYKNPYQPLPNAYMIGPDGEEQLTTVYQRDKVMMIDAIASKWVLRNSNGAIVVYNEMLNPK